MAVGNATFGEMHPVKGFRLGTTKANVKYADRRDLVVMEMAEGSTVAGTFTLNAFCAAPVQICKRNLATLSGALEQKGYWITNTGYANAGTGKQGMENAERVCGALAQQTAVAESQVFPFSTGVIGEHLPVEKILAGIPDCLQNLSENGWADAAYGIMTTDTRPKGASKQIEIDGKLVTITGLSKGAGMIKPNMATMLGYVATDAKISAALLQKLASGATQVSFNSITVDSDTSTNDSCMLVATGQSGVEINEHDSAQFTLFKQALEAVYVALAQAIIRDGEGATKFVTIAVEQAKSVAIRSHPNMLQSKFSISAAEFQVDAAEASMGPRVTFDSTISVEEDFEDTDYTRVGTVGLTLGGPIYQGGALSSLVRQAMALRDAERGNLHVVRHNTRQNAGNAWAALASAKAQVVATARQVEAARIAFEGIREESKLGARTTLDVLISEQQLLDAEASRITAQTNQITATFALLSSMGLLTTEHLNLKVERYDPEAYYELVKDAPAVRSERGKQLDKVLRALGKE